MSKARITVPFVMLTLAALSPVSLAAGPTDLGQRVTIDVLDATPQTVFEMLARELGCTITVSPALKKRVTLRAVDTTAGEVLVRVCGSIRCEYTFDGKNITVKPLTAARRRQITAMFEHSKKLESRLPAGLRFDGAPLKDVLVAIGKACGVPMRPWKDEGSRKVTIDIGGMTVEEALAAVVHQIGGEGMVMMRTWAGSWGQHAVAEPPDQP